MEEKKYLYPLEIKKMVAKYYGRESKIYCDMMSGKEISYLIKKSYKEKSKIRTMKIKDVKELYIKCKLFEETCNSLQENICN